jgi:hypothetical protein
MRTFGAVWRSTFPTHEGPSNQNDQFGYRYPLAIDFRGVSGKIDVVVPYV